MSRVSEADREATPQAPLTRRARPGHLSSEEDGGHQVSKADDPASPRTASMPFGAPPVEMPLQIVPPKRDRCMRLPCLGAFGARVLELLVNVVEQVGPVVNDVRAPHG